MGNENEYISRPVRIKLKKNNEIIEGNIIFNTGANQDPVLTRLLTIIKFRYNNAQQTEKLLSMMDIDTIEYL